MKGHFTIEWLSQSSQVTSCTDTWAPAPELGGPCTSSTPPECLPGLYCNRERGSSESPPERRYRQLNHQIQRSPTTKHPEPTLGLFSNPSSTSSQGFSSSTEEETSGYESEGERSLSPATSSDSPQTSVAGRRPRTAFTVEQINRLERAFKKNAYLGTHDKSELCKKLNLSDKQIRNWFQNRRMKLKRTLQDNLAQACQAKISSQLLHYPQLPTFGHVPQPGYYQAQENPSPYAPPLSLQYIPPHVGGAIPSINADSLYHRYTSLPSLFTTAASGRHAAPHFYPAHY